MPICGHDSQQGLAGLLASAVRHHADGLAIATVDREWLYRDFDDLVRRMETGMAERGVGRGDRVLLWTRKNAETVAAMQAAMRLGAAYVPMADGTPPARAELVATSCRPALVVIDTADVQTSLPFQVCTTAELANSSAAGGSGVLVDENDLAYILYTSGTTGRPKGVSISHRNALSFVCWAADATGLNRHDRLANHASFGFDLSVFDLYAAFHAAASVHLLPSAACYVPSLTVDWIRESRVSVWYSVPSALVLMMRQGGLLDAAPPPSLRTCLFAGEPFPPGELRRLRAAWPEVRMFNWYGPTETNVCTSYEVTARDIERPGPIPIGTACSGATVRVDAAAAGHPGEIVVSGPTVMLGYWGEKQATEPYRTGDLGREGANGDLEYLGRLDSMVKVRGYRVETTEIDGVLMSDPAVAEAAVVVIGAGVESRLHAAVVTAVGHDHPTLLRLKALCVSRLPSYMVIDGLTLVDELPRTENGKVHRTALAALVREWIEDSRVT